MAAASCRFPRGVLFDLDGTLLDSAPNSLRPGNRRPAGRAKRPGDRPALRPPAPRGARAMSAVAFPEVPPERVPDLVPEFLATYREELGRHGAPFPGVEALLSALEAGGVRWGIVTNKPFDLARDLLPGLGWAQRCAVLVGGDSL